jgi:hypothetical protein
VSRRDGTADRAIYWLLGVPLFCLIAACSRDTSDAGPRAAAAVAAIALQSDEFKTQRAARVLPVELDYQIPPALAEGRPATLELTLHTGLATGVLEVSVGVPPGMILSGATQYSFDLASAPRPLRITLALAPSADRRAMQRPLTVEVAARQGRERRTRVFQIVLRAPTPAPTPAPAQTDPA